MHVVLAHLFFPSCVLISLRECYMYFCQGWGSGVENHCDFICGPLKTSSLFLLIYFNSGPQEKLPGSALE